MYDIVKARRTDIDVSLDGINITSSMERFLISMSYTDCEEGETDDLQIKLADKDDLWLCNWLEQSIQAASTAVSGLKIHGKIIQHNWKNSDKSMELDCGQFELDSVDTSGPPSVVTLKATSLPFNAQIRQTKKSRAWEAYHLSGIAKEMANKADMTCMYESPSNPYYDRVEQTKKSDISFLSGLCKDAGLSLKCTDNMLVIFDQSKYEKMPAVMTFGRKDGNYTSYRLSTGKANSAYTSCRVRYNDPDSKKVIEGIAYVDDFDKEAKNNQQLEVTAKVTSVAQAKDLAFKRLRLHNKFSKTGSITLPGNPALVAGVTIGLKDWGGWSGKYLVSGSKHTVGDNGYKTQIEIRRVLEGY